MKRPMRIWPRLNAILPHLAALTLCAATAAADGPALQALRTGDDARGWEAVGRLNVGGRMFCTGALIAPDIVLTAAHCVVDPRTGQVVAPAKIQFLAGLRGGHATAERQASAISVHPDFDYDPDKQSGKIATDLAVVRLVRPVRNGSIVPFETATRPRNGAEVGVVSYGSNRQITPALQETCRVLARRSGVLVLDCEVEHGSSGAPVFVIDAAGVARVVSVISSATEIRGRQVALGTDLERPLADILRLLDDQGDQGLGGRPAVHSLSGTSGGGAKFVRP